MISNKLVTIIKENQFDKGWTLFSPASFEFERNWQFKKADLSNIVKLITFSTQVDLVLSEACLPSRVINELEWSNKYIKINIIAGSKDVVERYKNLSFDTCKIDEKVNINYIGITGKTNGYYMLDDDLCEIDDSIENIYFGSKELSDKYSSLEKAKMIIVCNNCKHQNFNNLLSSANKYGLVCRYVINDKYFDRDTYNFAKENKLELFVSNYVDDVILIINKDDTVSRMFILNGGYVVLCPIDRVSNYVGGLFKNLFLEDNVGMDKIPNNVYSCFNGENEKLNITDSIVVEKDINIVEMSDFVNEIFDSSITDKHNDYSSKARMVKYQFQLIPPLFDSFYRESSLYAPIHELHIDWIALNKINFDRIIGEYHKFMDKDSKLIPFVDFVEKFTNKLSHMVDKCAYLGYYSALEEAVDSYEEYQSDIFDDCLFMFNDVYLESFDSKFDKFDDEIEGYRKTIKEKEALVSKGIDVLSNKRRIEILNKKIEDLQALKAKFKENTASRSSKEADSFIAHCKNLVNGVVSQSGDDDSIGKIVNTGEESKLVKLHRFVSDNLKQINDYLTKSIACLKKMKDIRVPEDYPVFEKNGQRYITISELSEYDTTKELCKEYSLKCLARR